MYSYVAPRKPLLSIKNKLNRRRWCKERLHWGVEEQSRVIFLDESNFEVINRKTKLKVKRFQNEKFHEKFVQPRVQGGGGSAGIWGCISHKGPGCASLYSGRINADRYIETLKNHLLPSATLFYVESVNFKFQQDGASPHTAKKTQAWFEEQGIQILQNPPRSPDLNPIENIWAWIDRHLTRVQISSIDHLKEVLEQEWAKVSLEFCMSLVESMRNRVKKCYLANGGHFKA